MIRAIAGIVTGLIVWWVLFMSTSLSIVKAWPFSAATEQAIFENRDLSLLPTSILMVFLIMYVVIGLFTGWLTAFIARDRRHVWFVAGPLCLYAAYQHLFVLWRVLPGWYNLAVIVFIGLFIILGGRFTPLPVRSPKT